MNGIKAGQQRQKIGFGGMQFAELIGARYWRSNGKISVAAAE
jgi:hypothetical protein